jgi:drug/metabolite transporter (DMT)-like permease
MLANAVAGALGQYVVTEAYRRADTSGPEPIQYLRVVISVALGLLLLNEVPDCTAILGSLLVIGSALYITVRESSLRLHRPLRSGLPLA